MPRAKARYDSGGAWKHRTYTEDQWEALKKELRKKLRPFHPEISADHLDEYRACRKEFEKVRNGSLGASTVNSDIGNDHPADEWANQLLSEAKGAISMMLWLRQRLTKAELLEERRNLIKSLRTAEKYLRTSSHTERRLPVLRRTREKLSKLSHDFDIMLGVDADIQGCLDKIDSWMTGNAEATLAPSLQELIERAEATEAKIKSLPPARKRRDADHQAAVEMAIRVLRAVKEKGISTPTSASSDFAYTPPAVKILKILGDALGLVLSNVTWRDIIAKAKKKAPDLVE